MHIGTGFRWFFVYMAMVLALCVGLATCAEAQTVPGTLRISWTLPTQGCNVTVSPPICGPLTGSAALTAINVYVSDAPIPDDYAGAPTITLTGDATAATHTMQVPNGSTLYVRVRAVNEAGASAMSNQASKLISVELLPGVPTEVTIELEIGR